MEPPNRPTLLPVKSHSSGGLHDAIVASSSSTEQPPAPFVRTLSDPRNLQKRLFAYLRSNLTSPSELEIHSSSWKCAREKSIETSPAIAREENRSPPNSPPLPFVKSLSQNAADVRMSELGSVVLGEPFSVPLVKSHSAPHANVLSRNPLVFPNTTRPEKEMLQSWQNEEKFVINLMEELIKNPQSQRQLGLIRYLRGLHNSYPQIRFNPESQISLQRVASKVLPWQAILSAIKPYLDDQSFYPTCSIVMQFTKLVQQPPQIFELPQEYAAVAFRFNSWIILSCHEELAEIGPAETLGSLALFNAIPKARSLPLDIIELLTKWVERYKSLLGTPFEETEREVGAAMAYIMSLRQHHLC